MRSGSARPASARPGGGGDGRIVQVVQPCQHLRDTAHRWLVGAVRRYGAGPGHVHDQVADRGRYLPRTQLADAPPAAEDAQITRDGVADVSAVRHGSHPITRPRSAQARTGRFA